MMTDSVIMRGGNDASRAVESALKQRGQQEPEDYVFTGGPIDFVMRRVPRALAITTPSKRLDGLLTLQSALLKGQGIDVQVVEEFEAVSNPGRVADRLIGG